MKIKKVDNLMDEWWEKKHKGDYRMSGEFSWDEIREFGLFLMKKLKKGKEEK